MKENPSRYRGTDVSYSQICDRRLWLSLHNIFITDGNEYVKEGRYLSEARIHPGYKKIQVGSNVIDNIEFLGDGSVVVHEFKRGRSPLMADKLQLAHYLNCISWAYGLNGYGILHLTGSRKTFVLRLNEYSNDLENAYSKIDTLYYHDIPPVRRNWFCRRGCSYVEFCFGGS